MTASKQSTHWIDQDDAPDLSTPGWQAKFAKARKGRGPQKAQTKVSVTIRLDRNIVERFKAGGEGWQSRINEALKQDG